MLGFGRTQHPLIPPASTVLAWYQHPSPPKSRHPQRSLSCLLVRSSAWSRRSSKFHRIGFAGRLDYVGVHPGSENKHMRMSMRRFTRLTNGFSKKIENLDHAIALHFMWYNFARPHSSLGAVTTPAMASGVADHVWTAEEILALVDSN